MGQKVKSILNFSRELISEDSSTTIEKIRTKMIANDVSLIPIINNDTRNTGLIRRKKLWRLSLENKSITDMKEVIEDPLPEVSSEDELSDAMAKLHSASAVLVKNEDKTYTHLVTPRVIANALEAYSMRFKEVEELETNLRNSIEKISNEVSIVLENGKPFDLYGLEFSEHVRIISKNWTFVDFNFFDKKMFTKYMNEAREYRNSLMHFRLDINEEKIDSVRKLNKLF